MNHHMNFIRSARKRDLNIHIIHTSKESNFVADTLGKQGLLMPNEFIAWL